jgi:acetolactate synthase-1/2/3 large subunit
LKSLLTAAKRPIVIAGLQACEASAAASLRRLVAKWNCPVMMTYKSMGVVSIDDPRALGLYIGGAAEEPIVQEADLIVLFGLDAVEFPPHRWRYAAPIVELTAHAFDRNIVHPEVTLAGPLPQLAAGVEAVVDGAAWPRDFFGSAREHLRRRADASGGGPISPQQLVDAAMAVAPKETRITVDAGAHMLPVLHSWRSREPRQTLVSRGLATMGFALPAAIASALAEPDRLVIAFTGDGGLMMCTAELGTAVQCNCRLVVVVFNDASLTLIGAKQRRRQLPNAGVDFAPADFSRVAGGFGCLGLRVEKPEQLAPKMRQALAHPGPALVDVVIDPAAYHEQIISLLG